MAEISRRSALVGGLATALLGAGVAPAMAAAPAQGDTPDVPAAGAASDTGVDVDRGVAALDGIASGYLARSGIPGLAVAVVHKGAVVYSKGFGVREVGKSARITPQTVFEVASMSKAISSSAISAATKQTSVRWTDLVRRGRPDFTLADPYVSANVTLADMFSHRSGLPDQVGDILEDLGYDQNAILSRLRYEPLTPFRTKFDYTNYGITAAGVAAATSVGLSWEDFVQQFLFRPLGMASSTTTWAGYVSRTNRAILHERINGVFVPQYDFHQIDNQAPAGGVNSNVVDLAKWMIMLLAQGVAGTTRLIDVDTLKEDWTPRIIRSQVDEIGKPYPFYGYGWNIQDDAQHRLMPDHSGAFGTGAGSNVTLVPKLELGFIGLSNGSAIGLPEAVVHAFLDQVYFGLVRYDWLEKFEEVFSHKYDYNHQYDTPPPVVQPSRPLGLYVGTYTNPYFGPLTVYRNGSQLRFNIGPAGQVYDLNHYTGDVFWFQTRGETKSGQSGFTFAGSRPVPDTITVQAWNDTGLGTFTRVS